MQETEKK